MPHYSPSILLNTTRVPVSITAGAAGALLPLPYFAQDVRAYCRYVDVTLFDVRTGSTSSFIPRWSQVVSGDYPPPLYIPLFYRVIFGS